MDSLTQHHHLENTFSIGQGRFYRCGGAFHYSTLEEETGRCL